MVHDGYEFNRQMKVHNIIFFSKSTRKKISLRVCWESEGGSNCCHCEKCFRTILAVYAEGENPNDYGFEYSSFKDLCREIHKKRELLSFRYVPIHKTLRQNYTVNTIEPQLRWFYNADVNRLGEITLWRKAARKIKSVVKRIIH